MIRGEDFGKVIEKWSRILKLQHKISSSTQKEYKQYRKNRTFLNKLYLSLETKAGDSDIAPDKEEIKKFEEGIWNVEAKHKPKSQLNQKSESRDENSTATRRSRYNHGRCQECIKR